MADIIGNAVLYTTKEACEKIGRSKDSVLRWIRSGRIKDVARDRNNHRVWTEGDIKRFQELAIKMKKNGRQKILFNLDTED